MAKRTKLSYPWPFVGVDQPSNFSYPLDCTILAVDPGTESGWCIWSRGLICAYGHFNIFTDANAIHAAFDALRALPGPHVLVVERPFGAKFGTSSSAAGTGDYTWREHARLRGVSKIVRVFPATWRARVLPKETAPKGGWSSAKREQVRAEEQRVATSELFAYDDRGGVPSVIHPDVAPALLIGKWASYAGEVNAKLPKRYQRKAA